MTHAAFLAIIYANKQSRFGVGCDVVMTSSPVLRVSRLLDGCNFQRIIKRFTVPAVDLFSCLLCPLRFCCSIIEIINQPERFCQAKCQGVVFPVCRNYYLLCRIKRASSASILLFAVRLASLAVRLLSFAVHLASFALHYKYFWIIIFLSRRGLWARGCLEF